MPSFIERINSKEHLRNQGLFASTMAVCSLASGRARDGALYCNRWHREDLIDPPSEAFFAAAQDSIPRDLIAAKGIHYMRACAVLAIASIQNGQIKNMQKYSGLYHTLISMDGLYDEKLWPKVLSPIETEERRRLVRNIPFVYYRLTDYILSSGLSTRWTYIRLLCGEELFDIVKPIPRYAILPK
jgi:hypothetical protein